MPHASREKFGRRVLLGGLCSAAASLPLLRSFPVAAGGAALPKLLLVGAPQGPLVGPDGTADYEGWLPVGFAPPESALPASLPYVFEALEPHRQRLLFLEGLTVQGGAHSNTAGLLTGRQNYLPPNADTKDFTGSGISVDQFLAQELQTRVLNTAFKIKGFSSGEGYWSFLGQAQPVTPIQDPAEAFQQVFGGAVDTAAGKAQLERRTSVLDTVAKDLKAMRDRVPAADRPRLEAHLEAVHQLEQDLIDNGNLQCSKPGAPAGYDALDDANVSKVVRDHAEIIVRALACGWGRIATLQIGNFGGTFKATWPELTTKSTYTCHAIAHKFAGGTGAGSDGLSQADAIPLGLEVERAFSAFLATVLDKLSTTLDVDAQPLIDSTLVAYCRPMGANHETHKVLWIVAGGKGVGVAGGRFLRVGDGDTHKRYVNDVLASLCRGMGVDVDAFGDSAYAGDPIPLS